MTYNDVTGLNRAYMDGKLSELMALRAYAVLDYLNGFDAEISFYVHNNPADPDYISLYFGEILTVLIYHENGEYPIEFDFAGNVIYPDSIIFGLTSPEMVKFLLENPR